MDGLRILGAVIALFLVAFAIRRFKRGQLRRVELLFLTAATVGFAIAAVQPVLFDPVLGVLGFEPGNQRRLIVLLVLSNIVTLWLVFRAFTRVDTLSGEIGSIVDYGALRRLDTQGWVPQPGGCAVVIPAYNEADNLPAVLAEIPKEVCGLPVQSIVVADGCTDGTEEVAAGLGAAVIQRDLRRGQGAATRLGYIAAMKLGSKVVVSMDADGQHDPGEIERLVAPLLAGEADMVQGSRVLGQFEVESTIRKHGIRFFSRLLTFLSGTEITDPANGYRALLSDVLRRLDLRQDQFFVSELILDAAQKGLRVVERPITVRRRAHGSSKKGTTFRYALGFSKGLLGTWLRQPSGKKTYPLEPRWLANSGAPPPDAGGNGRTTAAPETRRSRSPHR